MNHRIWIYILFYLLLSACSNSGEDAADSGTDSSVDAESTDGGSSIDAGHDSGHDAGPVITCFRFVDVDSDAQNLDGLSWDTAFTKVQDGTDSAYEATLTDEGKDGCEVWVAQGTYYIFNTSQDDTLLLKENVHLYGGFAGTEDEKNQRDWEKNETTLDGHQEGWEEDAGTPSTDRDQAYHVVTGSNGSVLDGFTITGGWALTMPPYPIDVPIMFGGGMYNVSCSTTVRNCTFVDNLAYTRGGGIYNLDSSARIENCTFIKNYSSMGGAVSNIGGQAEIIDSTFSENSVIETNIDSLPGGQGGAVYNEESVATIKGCTFSKNQADRGGGGIYNSGGYPTIQDCFFMDNVANSTLGLSFDIIFKNNIFPSMQPEEVIFGGGGIFNYYSSPTITNCIFINSINGSILNNAGDPIINNCIFSNDTSFGIDNYYSSAVVTNSLFLGNGILSYMSDPMVTNCTLHGSEYNDSGYGIINDRSQGVYRNCVIWGYPKSIEYLSVFPDIEYSNIQNMDIGDNNINKYPMFNGYPYEEGYWSEIDYQSKDNKSILTDNDASWVHSELKGLWVQVSLYNSIQYPVDENGDNWIQIRGDISEIAGPSDSYRIYDYHLKPGSPCIDTGSDLEDPYDDLEAPVDDIEGNTRIDIPDKGNPGTVTDMGAYEYVP